jgi:glycosyltransferase involved in cell wall biosynthesis
MQPDVSVIMPAYRAEATIARAVGSALAQEGLRVEVVLCADDERDYWPLLPRDLRTGHRVTLCRTPAPRSGPCAARNIALAEARAPVIACLDADDAYAPGRLRRLLPLTERHGVATGPTREIEPASGGARVARPREEGPRLSLADICELRMPFSPVFGRDMCRHGWAAIEFAEDVILNVDLYCASGFYAFAAGADYLYHLNAGSRSHSADALARARAGYLQILELVKRRDWPEPVRALVHRVFSEDLANVERALASSDGRATWRASVRDAPRSE